MRLNGNDECLEIQLGETVQECDVGFNRDSDGKCIDLDECRMLDNPCGSHVCRNTPGDYTCECRNGYELGDGKTCVISKILVTWQSFLGGSGALLTDINGVTTEIQWSKEGAVSADSFCSLTFENQFYILG